MSYAAMTEFAAPAKRHPQIWRFVLGVVLAFFIYTLVVGAFVVGAIAYVGFDQLDDMMLDQLPLDTPGMMLVMLATFIGMALGPMVAARMAHARSGWTLFGPRADMLRDFVLATLVGVILATLSLVLYLWLPLPEPNLSPDLWLRLLPFALLGLLIQTGAEEVLFRGYFQQQLAARFRSPLVWMVLPSVLFGFAHFDPTMGPMAWLVVLATGTFGLVAADLTARTGTIGAASGLHFANNVLAILFVSPDRDMTGLALYVSPLDPTDLQGTGPLLLIDIGFTLVIWLIVRWAVRR